MPIDESLVKAAEPFARKVRSENTINRERRVDRAVDNAGNVILDGRDFIPLRSPDGSVWRIRVDNAGVLTKSKET